MPYTQKPRACTVIPCYIAYRCSNCNAVNVIARGVNSSVEYYYKDEKEEARRKANLEAERSLLKLMKIENTKKPWLFDYSPCKKCGRREPWSSPKLFLFRLLFFLVLFAGIPAAIAVGFFNPGIAWIGAVIVLVSIIVLVIALLTYREYDRDRVEEVDEINMPHVAADKEGLLKILYEIDPQNDYGNLDDFDNTLYAGRREYYEPDND